ncbi:MAG: DinB family protein [Terriglobia bacterium]
MGASTAQDPTPEFALAFRELMLQVLGDEMRTTCRVLSAIPDDTHHYRPNQKSRSAWELAWHIAADVWFLEGIAEHHFQPNPDSSNPNPCKTGAELADWYAHRYREALEKIRAMTPEQLIAPVTLGGVATEAHVSFPAFLYLMLGHLHTVHHRGQLSAYLRPMGAKVPSIYGASADEPWRGRRS